MMRFFRWLFRRRKPPVPYVKPPPQMIVLHGGHFDGKSLTVPRGAEYVVMPRLNGQALFDNGNITFTAPPWDEVRYQRDIVNYYCVEKECAPPSTSP